MPVFVILITFSVGFYLFYKIKFFRTKRPMERKWLSAKSSMALGLFVALFGINQLFLFQTATTYIISAVFVIIGLLSALNGFRAYRYFLPLAAAEADHLRQARL